MPARPALESVLHLLEQGLPRLLLSDTALASPGEPASRGDRLPNRFLSPRHAHGAHEVCWVTRGRCVLAVEARDLFLHEGDVCVVRPGEIHQLRPLPTLEPFDTLWWHVTAGGVNLTLAGFAGERQVIRGGFIPLVPSPVPAISAVVRELEGTRPRRELLVRTALLDVAARILRHLDETRARPSPVFAGERTGSWHVQRVAQYIEAHYGAGVTLDRLAEIAGLSPYYLTRLFARYTGRGVMTFLGDIRHREALSLLRGSELAVSEVGRRVGYDDPYYFSRVFRAREGCAPLHYRQRLRSATA